MIAAWILTLTLDAGRMFNYPTGQWTFGTAPGIEASCGPVTVAGTISYDRTGYFARDLTVSVEREVTTRFSLSASAGRYDYPGYAPDLTAGVSLRWRIK